MIDMIYVRFQLTSAEYRNAYEKLQKYLKEKNPSHQFRKKGNYYVTNAFARDGFQEIKLVSDVYGYRAVEIRLRPKLLIDPEGYYKVMTVNEFSMLSDAFNQLMQDKLNLNVTDLRNWQAKRVEPAADIVVDEELIPLYIQLFKRGNIPDYFTKQYWDDGNNVYLESKKNTVNWYSRYPTLKEKERKSKKVKYADYAETRGILRFETQKRNYNCPLHHIMDKHILRKHVMKYYKLIVGEGDYYSLDKARTIVYSSVNNLEKALDLIKILKLIDKCGGVSKARKSYLKGRDSKTTSEKFNRRINELRKLRINPVVLPKEWNITHLENLYDRIEDGFK